MFFVAFEILCRLEGKGSFPEVESVKVWLVKGGEKITVGEWGGGEAPFVSILVPTPDEMEAKGAPLKVILWLSGGRAEGFEGSLAETERFLASSGVGYALEYLLLPEISYHIEWYPLWPYECKGLVRDFFFYEESPLFPWGSWYPMTVDGKVFCPFGGEASDPEALPGIGKFALNTGIYYPSDHWVVIRWPHEARPAPGRRAEFLFVLTLRTDDYLHWDTVVISWPIRDPTVCDIAKIRELTDLLVWHPPDSGVEIAVWPGVNLPAIPWHRWVCECGDSVIVSGAWEGVKAQDSVMRCHLERVGK